METLYKNKVLSPVFQVVWSLMHYNKDILKHYTKNTHKDTLSASKWLFFIYIHIYILGTFSTRKMGRCLSQTCRRENILCTMFMFMKFSFKIFSKKEFKKAAKNQWKSRNNMPVLRNPKIPTLRPKKYSN